MRSCSLFPFVYLCPDTLLDFLSNVFFSVTPTCLSHFCLLLCTVGGSLSPLWCLSLLLAKVSWLGRGPSHGYGKFTLTYLSPPSSHWNRYLTDTTKNLTGVEIVLSFLDLLFYSQGMLGRVEVNTCCVLSVGNWA